MKESKHRKEHGADSAERKSPMELFGIITLFVVAGMMVIGTVNAVMEEGPLALFILIIPLFIISVPVYVWLSNHPKRKVVVEGNTLTAYYIFKKPYTFTFKDVVLVAVYVHPDDWVDSEEDIPDHIFTVVTKDMKSFEISGGRELYHHVKDSLEREVPDVCPWLTGEDDEDDNLD